MSLLVRPTPLHSHEFLTHPNTYALKLPTGSDFYFSIPFSMDWLRPLRPIELATLHDYLSAILDDVANRMGQIGMYSVFDVQHEISARLSSADQLTEIENGAWVAGHGFPVFNHVYKLTTFFWDWNTIHFECGPSVVAWYVRQLYDFQHKPSFERYAVRRSMRFEENKIGYRWWFGDGLLIIEWYCGREMVCIKTCGAAFRDLDEWKALKAQLEPYELDMLRKGKARLRNAESGGWELVVYSNEGRSGTISDTCRLEHGPYIPAAADDYFRQSHFSEEMTPSDSNFGDRCYYRLAPSPSSREHAAERVQTFDMRTSQTSLSSGPEPPHPSELLRQAKALAKSVRDIETRLFHTDKAELSPHISPKSLAYPKPVLNHTAPSALQLPTKTATFPITTIREVKTPTQQSYQAYAEDDNDDSTEGSIRAPPNSWRDV